MKETDITQYSPNGQPYIQRNFIRYGRKPILQKTCRKYGNHNDNYIYRQHHPFGRYA